MSCEAILSSRSESLPPIIQALTGFFLLLVIWGMITDVRSRRIANALNLTLLLAGVAHSVILFPFATGLLGALLGVLVGFAIWIGFYAMGVMGAGDVKFFAAAAAWLGPALAWRSALVAGVAGGVLSIVFLLRGGRLASTLHRLALLPLSRSVPTPDILVDRVASPKAQLPYGIALGIGAIAGQFFPFALCRL